jgi:hypothetical protein
MVRRAARSMETRTLSCARQYCYKSSYGRGADLPPGYDLAAVRCPSQREWLLANLDLAYARLGPNVPEPDHAICAAARKLVLVDRVEGDALKLRGARYAWRAQLRRVLDIGPLRIPYPQGAVRRAGRYECAGSIPAERANIMRRRHRGVGAEVVVVCGCLEAREGRREGRLPQRASACGRRHRLGTLQSRGTGRIVKAGQAARRVCEAVLSCKPRVATRRAVAHVGIHSLVTSRSDCLRRQQTKNCVCYEHQRTRKSHVQALAVRYVLIERRVSLVNI